MEKITLAGSSDTNSKRHERRMTSEMTYIDLVNSNTKETTENNLGYFFRHKLIYFINKRRKISIHIVLTIFYSDISY